MRAASAVNLPERMFGIDQGPDILAPDAAKAGLSLLGAGTFRLLKELAETPPSVGVLSVAVPALSFKKKRVTKVTRAATSLSYDLLFFFETRKE
jgi:hypothetical protein